MKYNLNDLFYVKEGNGDQVIIFLHGWGQTHESFLPIMTDLAKDYTVYGIDLPGFGQSLEPTNDFTIYDYNDLLEEFIKQKAIKKPILITHSFGGRIALIYGAKNDNLNKLVITGGAGIKPHKTFLQKLKIYNYKISKMILKLPGFTKYQNSFLQKSGSEDYQNASPVMKRVLVSVVNTDLTNKLEQIKVPTLLYWGENDDATPLSDGELMNHKIKQSLLIVKKNSGHYAFYENIEDFIKEIRKFIK